MPWPTRASATAEQGQGAARLPGLGVRLWRRTLVRVAVVVLALLGSAAVYAPLLASDLPYYLHGVDYAGYEAARRTLEPVAGALAELLERGPEPTQEQAWRERVGAEVGALELRVERLASALAPGDRQALEACRAQLQELGGRAADPAAARNLRTLAREAAAALAPRGPGRTPLDAAWMTLWTLLLAWWLVRRLPMRPRVALLVGLPALAALACLGLSPGATRGGASLKQGLTRGDVVAERVLLPPLYYGYAETNTSEGFRAPTWTAAGLRDEQGRAPGEAGRGDDPTGLAPATTPVEVRFGEPARNSIWRRLAGTDGLGRDNLVRMLWGGRVSLAVGLAAAALLTAIGLVLGALAGFLGGRVDFVVSRAIEVVLSIPALYLIVLAAAYVDPGAVSPLAAIVGIIAAVSWTGVARLARAEMLRLRESEFVLAARALGLPEWRVLLAHALPNALSPVLVAATFAVGAGILVESVVSYLGFGVQHPVPSWGALINASRSAEHWWVQVLPGLLILAAVASFNLLGEARRDVLDPRTEGSGS